MESSVQAQLQSVETSLNESIAGPQDAATPGDAPAEALPETPATEPTTAEATVRSAPPAAAESPKS